VDFVQILTSDVLPGTPLERGMFRQAEAERDPETAARYAAILENRTPPTVMEQALRRVPTKVPASRLKAGMLDDCVFFETDLDMGDGKLPVGGADDTWCDPQSLAAIRHSLALMESSNDNEFELLLSQNRRPTAMEKGTAIHLFLQYCDFSFVEKNGIENEIGRLREAGFISERVTEVLDRSMLNAFFGSAFFARVQTAERVERELRFARFVPLASLTQREDFAEALADRTLFVQGSIDLLCVFPDGHLEICDYKTDHITSAERADPHLLQDRMNQSHREQLFQYATAVEEMYGVRPTRAYVFSLPLGEAVEIELQ
jgi:hypothetical protein